MPVQIKNPEQIKTTENGAFRFTLGNGASFAVLSGSFRECCRTAKIYYMQDKKTRFGILNVERVTEKESSD